MSHYAFLNRVQLIGNLTVDPEIRQTNTGTAVGSFSIATNRAYKGADGELKEETEYHAIVVWAKLAELAGSLLKKGSKVFVEGRLKTTEWQNDAGEKRRKTEVIAENFIILSLKAKPEYGAGENY